MSLWVFTIPFAMCLVGIIGGIVLHFYAKAQQAREERFWKGHQTEWTDELARRREMRERAEQRYAASPYTNQGTAS